jgi:hypothetical protein
VSRLWPEQVTILLSPRRLVAIRSSGGLRSTFVGTDTLAVEPTVAGEAPWRSILTTLRTYIAGLDPKLNGAKFKLVLSDHFCRYALVPWSDELGSASEELMLAKHCFKSVYGSGADEWSVRITLDTAGAARLASAVDPAMLTEVDGIMHSFGRRFHSLQPHFVMCFNYWRRKLPKDGVWLITVDEGALCVARLRHGAWVSVNTLSVGINWRSQLPSIIEREEALSESGEDTSAVLVLAGDGLATPWPQSDRWRFQELSPTPFHEAAPRSSDVLGAEIEV